MTRAPEKFSAESMLLVWGNSDALVNHRDDDVVLLDSRGDRDGRSGLRIFCSIFEKLPTGLFDKNGIDVDQRQIVRHLDPDGVVSEAARPLFQGRVGCW